MLDFSFTHNMHFSNSFLPQLGYLMPATSASLVIFCLFHCVLAPLISGIFKVKEKQIQQCSQRVALYLTFVNFGPGKHYLAL